MLATHRITQGTQAIFKVPLLLDGVLTSIAGWSLVSMAKQSSEDADAAAILLCNAGNGRVTVYDAYNWLVTIPGLVTESATPGRYFLVHQGTAPDGEPHRLELCYLYIDPSIPD